MSPRKRTFYDVELLYSILERQVAEESREKLTIQLPNHKNLAECLRFAAIKTFGKNITFFDFTGKIE